MRRAIATVGSRLAAVTAALAAGFAGFAQPAPAGAAPAAPVQLNATDAALLDGVRLAGLWELPAGQMAADRGQSDQVRRIGRQIADEHIELDQLTVAAANRLGAVIPGTPTAEQQGWLKEMENATGARFDQIFVDRLRAAHGKIFPVIAAVRAGTRNPIIRRLAEDANKFVLNHIVLLESTGLVRFDRLAPAAMPPPQDTSGVLVARTDAPPVVNPGIIWTMLIGTLCLAGLATARIFARGRRSTV
jgi:predicted outer membrane protein